MFTAFVIFATSFISLSVLRPLAIRLDLVDVPNQRKSHNGHIPLVGGISTLLGIWMLELLMPDLLMHQLEYTTFSTLLVFVGLLDDKLDISATKRLIVIAGVAAWLVLAEGIALTGLGNLTGSGEITLGLWSLPFTIAAVIGCVTAFNMMDGIDGLLGVLAAVAIASLGCMFYLSGHTKASIFCVLFIIAMLPYVCFNLGLKVKSHLKVFMGDAGSFLVGFTIIWLLVFATQEMTTSHQSTRSMQPVTALWIVAIPLMDMALVMLRRIVKGRSPFTADRTHIHHVLIAYGIPSKIVLLAVSGMALLVALFGISLDIYQVADSTSFMLFLALFVGYCCFVLLIQFLTNRFTQAEN